MAKIIFAYTLCALMLLLLYNMSKKFFWASAIILIFTFQAKHMHGLMGLVISIVGMALIFNWTQITSDKTKDKIKPKLKLSFEGERVIVSWEVAEKDFDNMKVDIEVDHGLGTFSPMLTNIDEDFIDSAPTPSAKEVWNYKGRYVINGKQVGEWSEVVSIEVGQA